MVTPGAPTNLLRESQQVNREGVGTRLRNATNASYIPTVPAAQVLHLSFLNALMLRQPRLS